MRPCYFPSHACCLSAARACCRPPNCMRSVDPVRPAWHLVRAWCLLTPLCAWAVPPLLRAARIIAHSNASAAVLPDSGYRTSSSELSRDSDASATVGAGAGARQMPRYRGGAAKPGGGRSSASEDIDN